MILYTAIFYDENLSFKHKQESGDYPKFGKTKFEYYVIQGEWNGVVDPNENVPEPETNEQRLERELKSTKERLTTTEQTVLALMDEIMTM